MDKITNFQKLVYGAAKKIPKGKVASYKGIARKIGMPGASRAVGNALNRNPFAPSVPCHRVVKSTGEVGGFAGGEAKKKKLLSQEGIKIKDGKVVDFSKKLYRF